MAKKLAEQQKTDAKRIPKGGAGQLDRPQTPRPIRAVRQKSIDESSKIEAPERSLASARKRIEGERQAAIERLRQLNVSMETDQDTVLAAADAGRDEGDIAQASERTDMALMTKERLAERIEHLTAALERISQGRYGQCIGCGRPIGRARLAAIPETETCLECQQQREARTPDAVA